ncbi:hypothetical protein OF377_02910 [Ureaplasma sp. ES3154-GEN]|uniref:hypothetical protein n=1 Tax=Ureaplasma sp. ES3154-GEN TaxID=2984844 RepID=UPI0021E8DA62|nr:hypothetical protein [Ureaplasma sp. ES3154-GEN]MCV3743810.1 hypothetical protein [Ureaplasma sp. ES3154-GEN]
MNCLFFDYTLTDLQKFCVEHEKNKFLAKQVYEWVYGKLVWDFKEMSNISKDNRLWLANNFNFQEIKILRQTQKNTVVYLEIQIDNQYLYAALNTQNNQAALSLEIGTNCSAHCDKCASNLNMYSISSLIHVVLLIQKTFELKINHLYLNTFNLNDINLKIWDKVVARFNEADGLQIGKRKINWITNGWNFDYNEWLTYNNHIDLIFESYGLATELISDIFVGLQPNISKWRANLTSMGLNSRNLLHFSYFLLKSKNDGSQQIQDFANLVSNFRYYLDFLVWNQPTNTKLMTKSMYELIGIFAQQAVIRVEWKIPSYFTCEDKKKLFN